MASICNDLKIFLDNPPCISDVYQHWLQEADGFSEAELAARNAMTRWVKGVEAILEANGKNRELQIWRNATRPISTEFEDEERHKAVLQSIILRLCSEQREVALTWEETELPYKSTENIFNISPELLNRLRRTLLSCGPFDSNQALKAVFVDSRVSTWRDRLPLLDNSSSIDRVNVAISCLSRMCNDANENALILFLSVLSERVDPGDGCRRQLAELANELKAESTCYQSLTSELFESPIMTKELQPIPSLRTKLVFSQIVEECDLQSFGKTMHGLEKRHKDGWVSCENERLILISQSTDNAFWLVKKLPHNADWKRWGWAEIRAEEFANNELRVKFFNGRQVNGEWQTIGETSLNQFAVMVMRELENNQQLKYTEVELQKIDIIRAHYSSWQSEELTSNKCRDIVDTVMAEHCQSVNYESVGSATRITWLDTSNTEIGQLIITADGEVRKKPTALLRGLAWSKKKHGDFEHIPQQELERDAKFDYLCKLLNSELEMKELERLLEQQTQELANTNASTQIEFDEELEDGAITEQINHNTRKSKRCAIILTALPVEYEAIRDHLVNLQEITHPQGTVYERGNFSTANQLWKINIVEIGAGNPRAALEAERAIQYFDPDVIIFVGVAGGIKDVALGDVVSATKIYGYASGKAGETYAPRPEVGNSTYALIQRARAETKKGNWLNRIDKPRNPLPHAFVGPIAAGESVVASTKSATYKFIRAQYSDALAVEMEGFGILNAVQANSGIQALVIRGISDLLDHKDEVDATGFQSIAAQNASAFAFEVLANFVFSDRTPKKTAFNTAT